MSVWKGWVSPQIWKHLRDRSHIHQIINLLNIQYVLHGFAMLAVKNDLKCMVPRVIKASPTKMMQHSRRILLFQQALLFTQVKCGASFSGYRILDSSFIKPVFCLGEFLLLTKWDQKLSACWWNTHWYLTYSCHLIFQHEWYRSINQSLNMMFFLPSLTWRSIRSHVWVQSTK